MLGKKAGIFVALFDILKSLLAYKIARRLFPLLKISGFLASIGAILGHCFPIFMHFQGGKGLAAFGGLILAYDPWIFLTVIVSGLIAMFVLNTGVAAPILGCIIFPILAFLRGGGLPEITMAITASAIIVFTHWSNLLLAMRRQDVVTTEEFVSNVFGKNDNEDFPLDQNQNDQPYSAQEIDTL